MARGLLIAGAVLLTATALFHMTGLSSVAAWLDGDRGRILSLLWSAAAFSWAAVALIWAYAAVRPSPNLKWPVLIAALIPVSVGVLLLSLVDGGHPGGYMLLVSAMLAGIGAWRTR